MDVPFSEHLKLSNLLFSVIKPYILVPLGNTTAAKNAQTSLSKLFSNSWVSLCCYILFVAGIATFLIIDAWGRMARLALVKSIRSI